MNSADCIELIWGNLAAFFGMLMQDLLNLYEINISMNIEIISDLYYIVHMHIMEISYAPL